jgi:thymidylate synthase (FAD)
MRLIKQSYEILSYDTNLLQLLEKAGRTCYKSEDKITEDSAKGFISGIIKSGHESVIEHSNITVKFITSRACSHQLVRHRLASYSQESQRYVNYNNSGVSYVVPPWLVDSLPEDIYNHNFIYNFIHKGANYTADWYIYGHSLSGHKFALENVKTSLTTWLKSLYKAEESYEALLTSGWKPEEARDVLPNATATELVVTANLREWRHILKVRTSKHAHPIIRELMIGLLVDLKAKIPVIFDDIIV